MVPGRRNNFYLYPDFDELDVDFCDIYLSVPELEEKYSREWNRIVETSFREGCSYFNEHQCNCDDYACWIRYSQACEEAWLRKPSFWRPSGEPVARSYSVFKSLVRAEKCTDRKFQKRIAYRLMQEEHVCNDSLSPLHLYYSREVPHPSRVLIGPERFDAKFVMSHRAYFGGVVSRNERISRRLRRRSWSPGINENASIPSRSRLGPREALRLNDGWFLDDIDRWPNL